MTSRTVGPRPNLEYFEEAVKFLSNFQHIYDFKLINLFLERPYSQLPSEWCSFLRGANYEELNRLPFDYKAFHSCPESLKQFFETTQRLSISRVLNDSKGKVRRTDRFSQKFQIVNASNETLAQNDLPQVSHNPEFRTRLSPKKHHEVLLLSSFLRKEVESRVESVGDQSIVVIDVGSGLGYLGEVLSSEFGYSIINIEGQASHHKSALRRQVRRPSEVARRVVNVQAKLEDDEDSFAAFDAAVEKGLESLSVPSTPFLVMTGLHACADLTPSLLRLFGRSRLDLKLLVVAGCCYHLMSKRTSSPGDDSYRLFPLSSALREVTETRDFLLGRFGLRLAAQETLARWRDLPETEHSRHERHVSYRAILEVVVRESGSKAPDNKKPSKEAYRSFQDYRDNFRSGFNAEGDWETFRDSMDAEYSKYSADIDLIEPFTMLQYCMQGVLETLIIFDRVQYLRELYVDSKVTIAPVFDDEISPRNLAIVSSK